MSNNVHNKEEVGMSQVDEMKINKTGRRMATTQNSPSVICKHRIIFKIWKVKGTIAAKTILKKKN